jgi:glutathione S-transferase
VARIVLHQWEISPFCGKVRKILRRKNLAYETIEYGGLLAGAAAKLSRVGKLPVLDYDGTRIQDSTHIAAFLETRHPEPSLYPSEPAQRAQALLIEDWADESLYWYDIFLRAEYPEVLPNVVALMCKGRPAWEHRVFGLIFRRLLRKQLRGQGIGRQSRSVVESHLLELMSGLDAMLAGREWLVGSAISIADISVSAQLDEILRTSVLAPRIRQCSGVIAWLGRCDAAAGGSIPA